MDKGLVQARTGSPSAVADDDIGGLGSRPARATTGRCPVSSVPYVRGSVIDRMSMLMLALPSAFGDLLASPQGIQISATVPDGRLSELMPDSAIKDVARRLASDVFGMGDLDGYDEIFAEPDVNHNIPAPRIPGSRRAFADWSWRPARGSLTSRSSCRTSLPGHLGVFHDHVTATSRGAFSASHVSETPLMERRSNSFGPERPGRRALDKLRPAWNSAADRRRPDVTGAISSR